MSIAWAAIALLVLLLPGFIFIARLYSVERTARDSTASPLAFLAGAIPAAFIVQMALYVVFQHLIDLRTVLAVLQLQGAEAVSLREIADTLQASRWYILGYVVLSCVLGYSGGWVASALVRSGWLPIFVRHGHVRHLLVANETARHILYRESFGRFHRSARYEPPLTRAYVITKIQHNGHVVMYDGFLREFYFTSEGRIAYLVLQDCYRCYLDVAKEMSPETSIDARQPVGSPGETDGTKPPEVLMIDGSEVSNVYFEKGGIAPPKDKQDQLAYIEKATLDLRSEVGEEEPPAAGFRTD